MSFLESKLPVWAETWDLDQFEYVEFNGGVHFVCVCVCVCVCVFFSETTFRQILSSK